MPWLLGIDEAGYGPNLGPFVMSAVRCRVSDPEADLWESLSAVVRRGSDRSDGRILVDDSKVVYSSGKGLSGLERGVFSIFGMTPQTLGELTSGLCGSLTELTPETWFSGASLLPVDADRAEVETLRGRFAAA